MFNIETLASVIPAIMAFRLSQSQDSISSAWRRFTNQRTSKLFAMPIITGKGMVDYITQTLFLFVDKRQVFGPSVC